MADENQRRLTANGNLSNRSIIFKNLLGGIFWGVGSVIGATLIVASLLGLARIFFFIPGLEDFFSQIAPADRQTQLENVRQNLPKR